MNSEPVSITAQVTSLIDRALTAQRAAQRRRDYLGASRIGEPCERRLAYEFEGVAVDEGCEPDGRLLRVFDAGHVYETLSVAWLKLAGFDLRTHRRNGEQFGFATAGGRIRGHIDGVILNGPNLGIHFPILWEHKSATTRSWSRLRKHGLRNWRIVYWGQVQLYMAYMDLRHCLFTVVNKDTQELHHELLAFDAAAAQELSDKGVRVLRAVEAGALPPRITAEAGCHHCRFCPYAARCWENVR
ncbi:MAG: PD-(D/E)XK nuclease family protein [Gammaproteobacteria bacterium]|nr:PD-(D/E)XK nuclease family protein [Gammaproteobacteria bacterium]